MKQNKIKQTPPRQWTYPTRIPFLLSPEAPSGCSKVGQRDGEGRDPAGKATELCAMQLPLPSGVSLPVAWE